MSALEKSVMRPRLSGPYRFALFALKETAIAFGLLVVFFGVSFAIHNLPSYEGREWMLMPKDELRLGYHGYSGGTTRFRDLEIKDGGKVALYPDDGLECKMISPKDFKEKIRIYDSTPTHITKDSKTLKCQN